jgi:hypothetical protein
MVEWLNGYFDKIISTMLTIASTIGFHLTIQSFNHSTIQKQQLDNTTVKQLNN